MVASIVDYTNFWRDAHYIMCVYAYQCMHLGPLGFGSQARQKAMKSSFHPPHAASRSEWFVVG